MAFVDPADTEGFIGLGGSQNVFTTAAQGASVLPTGGTMGSFTAYGFGPTSLVTLTVVKNGTDTAITCALPAAPGATSTCTAAGTIAFTANDKITVKIANGGGSLVRNVGFTMTYATG